MSNIKVVDVIIRKTAEKTKLTGEGNLSVSISSPSVIEIQGSAQDVARYVRQGKDLLIYMKDGSVIRCHRCGKLKEPSQFSKLKPVWCTWCITCENTPIGDMPK